MKHTTSVKHNKVKLDKMRYACNQFNYNKYLLHLSLGHPCSFSSDIPEVISFRLQLEMGHLLPVLVVLMSRCHLRKGIINV